MSDKPIGNDLIYSIIFDIPKDERITITQFSECVKDCLRAIDDFNHAIISGIDSSIEVVSYVQELKSGSIDFHLVDKIINGAVEGLSGYASIKAVELILKQTKTIWFKINANNIQNKAKEAKIFTEIKAVIEDSNINNELKGYILNEKQIIKAVRNFAKSSKKIKDNVYYRETKDSEKIQINSSLSAEDEDVIKELDGIIERIETATIRIIKPDLDGKSMWQCYWNKRIKCNVEDEEFIKKVKDGFKIGSKMRFKVRIKIIETLDMNGNTLEGKERYTLLEVEETQDIITPSLF